MNHEKIRKSYQFSALPADDEVAICNIFDNGITFFKDEESFRTQSSTINRPLSEVE